MVTTDTTAELTKKFGKNAKDSGSSEVQVAILTAKIKDLTSHFEKHKKDHSGMRGLMRMIGKRKSLLSYLSKTNTKSYQKLIAELGLRK
jgi:small subunit ribosomal protein S15